MKRIALAALVFCVATFHAARAADYQQCIELVQKSPSQAEKLARNWREHGGGVAAMHCHALALTALRRYAEAARELDGVARDRDVVNPGDRADLLDQAGNAWMLAAQPANALGEFSAALNESPRNMDARVDRARARAALGDWAGADSDLSAAILEDQNRADLLVLRAHARWCLGHKEDAATDIVRALTIYPNYPPALVERGEMKFDAGDAKGARDDWKKAASSGDSSAAMAAKRDLDALDGPHR